MRYFRLVHGTANISGTRYNQGSLIETDLNLEEMFKGGKFKEEFPPQRAPKAKKAAVEEEEEEEELDTNEEADLPDLGTDVTETYDDAKEAGVLVFEDANGLYNVARVAEPGVALNKKPMRKNKVAAYLEKLATE